MIGTVFAYSWGAGWIYAASFVTIASNIDPPSRGRVLGTGLAAFYFASAWWTEVTEYCCTGHTTFEKSAWRHLPIAGTAIVCSAGIYKLQSSQNNIAPLKGGCKNGDARANALWVGYMVLLCTHTFQWAVTGGAGSRDLSNFVWGDIPFSFMALYFVGVAFFIGLHARNVLRHGARNYINLHRHHTSDQTALKNASLLVGHSGDYFGFKKRSYRYLCAIVAINIGIVQTVAYNWESIKYKYGHGETAVAPIYNISRVMGCLVTGALVDRGVSRTKSLVALTMAVTISQLLFGIGWSVPSLATTSWGYLPKPWEKIPLIICAFSAGSLYTIIPVMEVEWYGTEDIGRIHGTTLLCAILGQTILYNLLGSAVSFEVCLWIQMGLGALSSVLALRIMADRARGSSLSKSSENSPLLDG